MDKRFQFRRVNEITGTFVLVVVAVLIAAVVPQFIASGIGDIPPL